MSKCKIFIIIQNEVLSNDVKILATFSDKLKAIAFIQKQIEIMSKNGFHIMFHDSKSTYVFEKCAGWLTYSKNLKYIYQMHEFSKYTNDHNGIDTVDESE